MADISKISVNDTTYDIKDPIARGNVTNLEASLGTLAYKNNATGSVIAAGTVTAPNISVNPSTSTIKAVNNVGTLPNWSASVSSEVLSFAWSAGALTTTTNKTVVTGIADATASAPVFSGTAVDITVS